MKDLEMRGKGSNTSANSRNGRVLGKSSISLKWSKENVL
jgi:hypothetical protein